MSSAFEIRLSEPKFLGTETELTLVRSAFKRNPRSPELRNRLAHLLNKRDEFDQVISLYQSCSLAEFNLQSRQAFAHALFAKRNRTQDVQAELILKGALDESLGDKDCAQILADLAKAKLRLGERKSAIELLEQSLKLNPANVSAFKRLSRDGLRNGRVAEVLELTDGLIARGVGHSRLLSARMMALAAVGRVGDARELAGLDRFLHQSEIGIPKGWDDLDSFNAQIASEILANHDLRFGRHGTASEESWRVDDPVTGNVPAIRALVQVIKAAIECYVKRIENAGQLWVSSRPRKATLNCWCIITEAKGHELWHMHHLGWMTGGYYPQVPDAVAKGTSEDGCLEIGVPDGLIGQHAAAAFGKLLVRPRPGLLTLFPSHTYHRTHAHNSSGQRLCIAFDLVPG